ncbi:MAG: hypothetical protein WCA20_17795 [Candidatus Sulfotelmatobacter sp.]
MFERYNIIDKADLVEAARLLNERMRSNDWMNNSFLNLGPTCGEGTDWTTKSTSANFVAQQQDEQEEPE